MFYTIYVGLDMPLTFLKTSGANLPYQEETFLGLGLIFFFINVKRSIRRWFGMILVNQTQKFTWNVEVTKERKKRVVAYNLLEALAFGVVAFVLYKISEGKAIFPFIGLFYCTVDNIIFTLVGILGKKYRIGITKKAIMLADRDVQLVYYNGLRKITHHQDTLYFDYINGLQLYFPIECVPTSEKANFVHKIEENINRDKVFFDHMK